LKINLFSSWYSWKIAELALNNNQSHNHSHPIGLDSINKEFIIIIIIIILAKMSTGYLNIHNW